jgi:hypothetical protein
VAAKVTSVSDVNYTCEADPVGGGATIGNIRLKPVIDATNKGILALPVVGSYILVGFLMNKDSQPFMIMGSVFKYYQVKTDSGAMVLLYSDGTVQLNGDSFGGIGKVEELVTRLNLLEQAFNTHVHSGVTTGGGTSAVPVKPVVKTNKSDIENNKVKHG